MQKRLILSLFIAFASVQLFAQETHRYHTISGVNSNENDLINAAESNPDDFKANYNLVVYYFNKGVTIIENMDYNQSHDALYAQQEKVTELFKKALPYALKAHKMENDEATILRVLSGIYFGLGDIEKSKVYDAMTNDR